MNTDKIKEVQEAVNESNNIVFFGGAGVSTESGIPDFRSVDGLYNQTYDYPPETILSHGFFMTKTAEFYKFYRAKMLCKGVKPNITHIKLAELERGGRLKGIVTQNIDGLHQAAGSRHVDELHGSVLRNYCMKCHKSYDMEYILESGELVPHCSCGGIIKPDVVLYEESLDDRVVEDAVRLIAGADILIVGGTSLTVYPAAGLIRYFSGRKLILINRSDTQYDPKADIRLNCSLGDVFSQL